MQKRKGRTLGMNDVIIIGGGCAGLTAALYCARAALSTTLFAGNLEDKGGLLVKTSIVENFPGFPDGVLGFDLISNMEQQAAKQGAKIVDRDIVRVDFSSAAAVKKVVDDQGVEHSAKAVIIATGSKPLRLGLPRENEFWSNGISSCAVCDGALYKNKNIVVVGGGDTAMEEALFLTKFSDVTLIHRRDAFRASQVMQKRVLAHPKISVIYNSVVIELIGDKRLSGIVCRDIVTGLEIGLPVDGLFYGLGLKPNTTLFRGVVDMDEDGYIAKRGEVEGELSSQTSIAGVFVAGDAHDRVYRQAIVASGDGCKAAMDASNYINSL